MPTDHFMDNLKCPRLSWDRWGHLGPGTGDAHRPCQGQPGMSKVVLGQRGHLGPGTGDAHRPHQGQPGMSKVVLGQMGTSWTWDWRCPLTMSGTTCQGCPETGGDLGLHGDAHS